MALKNQADKVLTDSLELISGTGGILAVLQVPQKKGLPREDRLRLAASRMVDLMKSRSWPKAAVSIEGLNASEIRALAEGFLLSAYDFRRYKSEKKSEKPGAEVVFLVSADQLKKSISAAIW
jgi:leucyl aminopeptidase